MNKIDKKPSLEDYDEGWENEQEKIPTSLVDLAEMLEQKLENEPPKKDKIIWRIWRQDVNLLVNAYNEKAGFKAYKNVK